MRGIRRRAALGFTSCPRRSRNVADIAPAAVTSSGQSLLQPVVTGTLLPLD